MIQARPWRLRSAPASDDDRDLLSQLLVARGVAGEVAINTFLKPELSHLPDGKGMPSLDGAAKRICDGFKQGVIGICGDYDADGVCGTALLVGGLQAMGGQAEWIIPDRFVDGYGMQPVHARRLINKGAKLLITVDNGIRSPEAVATARAAGVDVIITDHHIPDETLPDTPWIVNPALPQDESGLSDLCGTAVAFYLLTAVRRELRERKDPAANIRLGEFLDLVALATVSDMMELRGVNRTLVHFGLQQMRNKPSIWVEALARAAGINPASADAQTLGFQFGPRLNAAGRMGDAGTAVKLLLSQDLEQARVLADQLEQSNQQRRFVEQKVMEEAIVLAGASKHGVPIVAASSGWHQGVLGIAASKLMHRLMAPVLLGSESDGSFVASARSVPGFNLHDALAELSHLYDRFGGHEAAAGLTAPLGALPEIRKQLIHKFKEQYPDGYAPPLEIDAILEEEPDFALLDLQNRMSPFGRGNEIPIYALLDQRIRSQFLMKGKHLRIQLQGMPDQVSCIGWNMAEVYPLPEKCPIHLAVEVQRNEFKGKVSVQLVLQDVATGDPFAAMQGL